MIRTFIQVLALIFTLEAALFLAKGGLGLSAKAIADLSTSWWDFNPALIDNLAHQRVDTWIGVIFLLFAFVLQMANTRWPMRGSDFEEHRSAALYAIVLSFVIGFSAFFAGRSVATNVASDIKTALEAASTSTQQERIKE